MPGLSFQQIWDIWPCGLIVCASLHEQNVIFYANIIMAHLNRPIRMGLKWPRYIFEATCTVGIAPQCPHPTPPLAMFGCEKPILRHGTNSFNIHNSIFNKFNDLNQVRCPNKSCYIKILHYQKAVKRRKKFDFVRNKSVAGRPKPCEIVNSWQNLEILHFTVPE
jgi:hypothetical protein